MALSRDKQFVTDPALLQRMTVLPKEVREAVLAYAPLGEETPWEQYREFCLDALLRTAPATKSAALDTLRAIFMLVLDCVHRGVNVELESVFAAEEVETFAARARARAAKQRQGEVLVDNQVSRLRTIGALLNPASNWPVRRESGPRRPLERPYQPDELEQMSRAAHAIRDARRRRIAIAALAMGLGAGLSAGEQHRARVEDVATDPDGLAWINVRDASGRVSRQVPFAEPWGAALLNALKITVHNRFAEHVLPIGRNANAYSDNLSTSLLGKAVPRIESARLRTTWLVQRLQAGIWIPELQQVAGLVSLDTIMKALQFLPAQDGADRLMAMTARVGTVR